MRRPLFAFAPLLGLVAPPVAAQTAAAIPSPERQIAWAVEAAPERMRADATVIGYGPDGRYRTLRKGTGSLVCLADDPKTPNHHVSCYHRDLEPFMARGRELRALGKGTNDVQATRLAEIKAGTLKLPTSPAVLYQLIAPPGNADAATGAVQNAQHLSVVYIPYATSESTGLSIRPLKGQPWLMDPGLPWAHIMITP